MRWAWVVSGVLVLALAAGAAVLRQVVVLMPDDYER